MAQGGLASAALGEDENLPIAIVNGGGKSRRGNGNAGQNHNQNWEVGAEQLVDFAEHRRISDRSLMSESRVVKMLMNTANENPISIAFGAERSSGMDRGDLGNLNAFVAVADHRSFRAAASQLGVTPSALSHSMRQLEERLGVRLLNRTTRSVSVTDAGRRLLDRLRPAIDQIDGALEDLNHERKRPMGRLRIYATHLAAAAVIAPIWKRFLSTYPEVHLELAVAEATIDIVSKGFDAGIGSREGMPAEMLPAHAG